MSSAQDSVHPTVELGGEVFPCIPQPLGRLTRRLAAFADPIVASMTPSGEPGDEGSGFDTSSISSLDDFLKVGASKLHALLVIFYPQMVTGDDPRMPLWRFDGWSSKAAWESGEDDLTVEVVAPTAPEIKAALLVAFRENDLDTIKELRSALPFDGAMRWVRRKMVLWMETDLAKEEAVLDSRLLASSTSS